MDARLMESAGVVSKSSPSLICASSYQRDSRRFKTDILSTRPGSNKTFLVTNATRCFTAAVIAVSRSNWEVIPGNYSQFLRTVLCEVSLLIDEETTIFFLLVPVKKAFKNCDRFCARKKISAPISKVSPSLCLMLSSK